MINKDSTILETLIKEIEELKTQIKGIEADIQYETRRK
jgi:cell division septum initiation protein DivIVA